ncbi:MAG TPA: hypothetical protein VKC17_07615 [Sphingomicrobium sp.]|nr:hypothetical protein [Sphingomicrobium sp.]
MTGAILIVIGVVALFAAIVGGGIKVRDIEVGSVPSKWRQGLLALFGVFIAFVGLLMWVDDDDSAADSNKAAAVSNIAVDEAPGDSNAVAEPDAVADANAAEIPAEDPNQAAPTEENAAQ